MTYSLHGFQLVCESRRDLGKKRWSNRHPKKKKVEETSSEFLLFSLSINKKTWNRFSQDERLKPPAATHHEINSQLFQNISYNDVGHALIAYYYL